MNIESPLPAPDTCPDCDDSGYVETYHGGVWTGEGLWSSLNICACLCGEDVRRERGLIK